MPCILAATDLSTWSGRAVKRALQLGAKLCLPCRVVSFVNNDLPDDMLTHRVEDVTHRLDRYIGTLAAPGQVVTSSVVAGDPHRAIVDQAEAHDADLLVLSLHRSRPSLTFSWHHDGPHRVWITAPGPAG